MADQAQNLEQAVDQAVETVADQLGQLTDGVVTGDPIGLENLLDVPVNITVLIGTTRMSLGDLVAMGPGSLIPLDREAHEPADILVNGRVIARGEVVTIDNTYGVRISHLEKDL